MRRDLHVAAKSHVAILLEHTQQFVHTEFPDKQILSLFVILDSEAFVCWSAK